MAPSVKYADPVERVRWLWRPQLEEDFRPPDEETYERLGDLFSERRAESHFEARLNERCEYGEGAEHETRGSKVDKVTAKLSRSRTHLRLSWSQVNLLQNPTVSFSGVDLDCSNKQLCNSDPQMSSRRAHRQGHIRGYNPEIPLPSAYLKRPSFPSQKWLAVAHVTL